MHCAHQSCALLQGSKAPAVESKPHHRQHVWAASGTWAPDPALENMRPLLFQKHGHSALVAPAPRCNISSMLTTFSRTLLARLPPSSSCASIAIHPSKPTILTPRARRRRCRVPVPTASGDPSPAGADSRPARSSSSIELTVSSARGQTHAPVFSPQVALGVAWECRAAEQLCCWTERVG